MRDVQRASTVAATLIGWSVLSPRLPQRWNPLPQLFFSTAVARLTRAPLGLAPPSLWQGVRWGSAAAAPVLLAIATGLAISPVRAGMGARELPDPAGAWLLLHIPFGTVWSEELTYRAALGSAAEQAFGATAGRMFTAAVFGLSHVPDARAANEPVAGTVVVTAGAGWIFSWLHAKSGSLAAPVLAHLAVNEAGAVAALAVQRRRCGRGRPDHAAGSTGRRFRS